MEKFFTYLALGISITGLLVLAFASESLSPPISKIEQIDTNSLGKNVHIHGNISRIHRFGGGSMLLVIDDGTGEIDVYIPYRIAQHITDLTNSSRIDVIGEVTVYKGKTELIVNDIDNIKFIK